jgi:hypothetical protein
MRFFILFLTIILPTLISSAFPILSKANPQVLLKASQLILLIKKALYEEN